MQQVHLLPSGVDHPEEVRTSQGRAGPRAAWSSVSIPAGLNDREHDRFVMNINAGPVMRSMLYGGIAQLVERRTDNSEVRGSIPCVTTITFPGSSAVEQLTVNQLAVGSIPTQGAKLLKNYCLEFNIIDKISGYSGCGRAAMQQVRVLDTQCVSIDHRVGSNPAIRSIF